MNDETMSSCEFTAAEVEVESAYIGQFRSEAAARTRDMLEAFAHILRNTRAQASAPDGEAVAWRFKTPVDIEYGRPWTVTADVEMLHLMEEIGGYEFEPLFTRSNAKAGEVDGVARIASERRRQIKSEGYGAEHDAEYADRNSPLIRAAICYAAQSAHGWSVRDSLRAGRPSGWPWELRFWKPGPDNSNASRIRELEKAGALIAAEIDRLSTQRGDGSEMGMGS